MTVQELKEGDSVWYTKEAHKTLSRWMVDFDKRIVESIEDRGELTDYVNFTDGDGCDSYWVTKKNPNNRYELANEIDTDDLNENVAQIRDNEDKDHFFSMVIRHSDLEELEKMVEAVLNTLNK